MIIGFFMLDKYCWIIVFNSLDVGRCSNNFFNTLRRRQNGHRFPDAIFNCIFLNETFWILNKISLKYVPHGLIDNMAALVQIMAWGRSGDKPLSEAIFVCFTDAHMRHSASISWTCNIWTQVADLVHEHWLQMCSQLNVTEHFDLMISQHCFR